MKKNPPPQPDFTDLMADRKAVIKAVNEFAFSFFYSTLRLDTRERNKLTSPLSIYLALSILCNGAAGSTKDAIAAVLGIPLTSIDQLNIVSRGLLHLLPAQDSRIRLSIANSFWYSQSWPSPSISFLNTNKEYYDGLIQSLDFSDPSAAKIINGWIAENTDQKITSIVDKTDVADLIYLVNAIYFNGPWLYPFEPDNTFDAFFHLADGGKVPVPFMSQTRMLPVWQGPSFTLVELPYGFGQAYSMYLISPADQQQSLHKFVANFDQIQLQEALSMVKDLRVRLLLPRWEYAYAIDDMRPQLTELGMSSVFSHADLSAMYPPELPTKLTKSIHKTYIKVGEVGTEAAAVTAIGVRGTGGSTAGVTVIQFNHPFLYFIMEKQTGVILFMGTLDDPSQNG